MNKFFPSEHGREAAAAAAWRGRVKKADYEIKKKTIMMKGRGMWGALLLLLLLLLVLAHARAVFLK